MLGAMILPPSGLDYLQHAQMARARHEQSVKVDVCFACRVAWFAQACQSTRSAVAAAHPAGRAHYH